MADLRERPRALTPPARGDAITLDALARAIDDLHAKVDRLLSRHASTLRRADRAALARLLPAISAGGVGSAVFACRDLFEHESAAVQLVLRGLTPKKLGELFRRGAGHAIGGLIVECEGVEGHVCLWKISATDDLKSTKAAG